MANITPLNQVDTGHTIHRNISQGASSSSAAAQPEHTDQIKAQFTTDLARGHIRGVMNGIQKLITPYLASLPFQQPSIAMEQARSKYDPYAEFDRGTGKIHVYPETFAKLGLNSKQTAQAMAIVLSHEMTHAWQNEHAPKATRAEMEGHAVWVQSKFAQAVGLQEINRLGMQLFSEQGSDKGKSMYLDMFRYYSAVEKEQGVAGPTGNIMASSRIK